MKRIAWCLLMGIFSFALAGMPLVYADVAPIPIEGNWQGTLSTGGINLRVVFHITRLPDQSLAATLDSPDQGAMGLAIEKVTLVDRNFHLEKKAILAHYDGVVSDDNTQIVGNWTQGAGTLPLTLKKVDTVIALRRPQEPKKPYPYQEEEVVFDNAKANVKLAGTLTLPESKHPVGAIVLVSGSGPNDRDETIFGHHPFWVLADDLTRRGIAVLRYDKRGCGKSTGNYQTATTFDFASDAHAAFEYLRQRPEIDKKRIGLLGHSEGGLIVPIVATDTDGVAFCILMAGPGVSGDQIMTAQNQLIGRAMGVPEATLAHVAASQQKAYALLKSDANNLTAEPKLRAIFEQGLTPEQKTEPGAKQIRDAQIAVMLTPWFRTFIAYDPKSTLKRIKCPVLAINGERDMQVPPHQNLPVIEAALKSGGNRDYTILELPGLNHLMQPAPTGVPTEYAQIETTIDPAALKTIGDWVVAHTKS